MRKKLIYFILFLLCLILNSEAFAAERSKVYLSEDDGDYVQLNGTFGIAKIVLDRKAVFCISPNEPSPISRACDLTFKFGDGKNGKARAAIGYLINNYNSNDDKSFPKYYFTQLAIHNLICEKIKTCNGTTIGTLAYSGTYKGTAYNEDFTTLYNASAKIFDLYGDEKIELNALSLEYKNNNNEYSGTVTLKDAYKGNFNRYYDDYNIDLTVDGTNICNNDKCTNYVKTKRNADNNKNVRFNINIPVSLIPAADKVDVEITVTVKKSYKKAEFRGCGVDVQDIALREGITTETKTASASKSKEIKPEGVLEINKYITGTTTRLSGAEISIYNGSGCSGTLKTKITTDNKQKLIKLPAGNYSVKETKTPTNYTGDGKCEDVTVSVGDTETVKIYNSPIIQKGKLCITKVKSNGEPIKNKNVGFYICNDYRCLGAKNSWTMSTGGNGKDCIELDAGTYYLQEFQAPSPFVATNKIFGPYIVEVGKTTNDTIENFTQCELDFNADSAIANRLALYKTYGYRNLLNFGISKGSDACTNKEPVANVNVDCMTANTTSTGISSTDLSNYTSTINVGSNVGYCYTKFSVTPTSNLIRENNIKAGRWVLTSNSDLSILTATLTKECYVYTGYSGTVNSTLNYSNYISGITIKENQLQNISATNSANLSYQGITGSFKKYSAQLNIEYAFDSVMLEPISGKYSDSYIAKSIGYGILSNFNDKEGINTYNFELVKSPSLDENELKINSNVGTCQYEVNHEIITYDDPGDPGKLELEFRIIDTNSPFSRNTKTNWCNGSDCSSGNETVKNNISNKTNSYGRNKNEPDKQQKPIYKIELTPNDIDIIKKYNKTTHYDDYKLTCIDEVAICDSDRSKWINSFLHDLEVGTLNTYREGDVDTVIGNLSHKLER